MIRDSSTPHTEFTLSFGERARNDKFRSLGATQPLLRNTRDGAQLIRAERFLIAFKGAGIRGMLRPAFGAFGT